MNSILTEKIARARELLETVRHIPLATVNADGSPHNSPVFGAFDDQLNMFWCSHPGALHSQNIARTSQVFIVVFDSMQKGGGLFIQGQALQVPNANLDHALNTFNMALQKGGRPTLALEKSDGG